MWVAKIKFSSKGTLIGAKAEKYGVTLFDFVLSYFYEKDEVIVHTAGTLFGSDKNKMLFVNELKKEDRVLNFEVREDFFVGTIKEPSYTKQIYTKEVIQIAPVLISDKGYEIITIGCFKREPLIKIANILKRERSGNLISIQQKKIKSISVMRVHPELTKKQKISIELAIKNGYYHSPRNINVKNLAKLAKLSFSTYQVHLRKAEEKLIPYFFE